MAKPENGSFRSELLSAGLYKRNQGRLARQLTAAGLGLLVVAGAYILSQGPLAGLSSDYYQIVFDLPKDSEKEAESLDKLAARHHLEIGPAVTRGSRRELQFKAPTSRFWTANSSLANEAKKNADEFVAAAGSDLDLKPARPVEQKHERAIGIIYGVPVVVCLVLGWVVFRLVNYPRFAEFLISVEAEMNKVSWASKQELYRATVVVLSTMIILGAVLMIYDTIWYRLLQAVGVLRFTE